MTRNIRDIIYIGLFAIILAICSWISIPMVVPFTLEIFGVCMAALVLGGKRGTIAVSIYILLGAIGLPVFSGFRGGLGVLFGNTGGYIMGFVLMTLIIWGFEKWSDKNKWIRFFSMMLGLLGCYGVGTIWFLAIYTKNTGELGIFAALGLCVLPYVIPDAIKLGLAYVVSKRIKMVVRISK